MRRSVYSIAILAVAGAAVAYTLSRDGEENVSYRFAQVERGDIVSGLWASQSHLYSRFDYGLAVSSYDWAIEPRFGAFAHSPGPADPGESEAHVYFVDAEEAAVILPGIYGQMRQQTPGAVGRSP